LFKTIRFHDALEIVLQTTCEDEAGDLHVKLEVFSKTDTFFKISL